MTPAYGIASMEPDDLKLAWQTLSRRLERHDALQTHVLLEQRKQKALSSLFRQVADAFLLPVGIDAQSPDRMNYRRIFKSHTSPFGAVDLLHARAGVLGSEGEGLRRLVAETCDFLARLEIDPRMESLNVSVAAGIALYLMAQRQVDDPG